MNDSLIEITELLFHCNQRLSVITAPIVNSDVERMIRQHRLALVYIGVNLEKMAQRVGDEVPNDLYQINVDVENKYG